MSGNTPLRFLGVGNMLDREYRNSPAFQWARELARNGIEAAAKNIYFTVEWEAVEAKGVYRLMYADDGVGMTREQLREYMVTLGKGGKVVGGPHDNYALGSRMTLLPWNPEGVVVISMVDGEQPWMVKIMFDPEAADGEGEYVLEEVEWVDENGSDHISTVYPPYPDPELGIDWMDTIPKVMRDAGHGTSFVLLGRGLNENTFDGDTDRNENNRELVRKYFNIRFWDMPEDVSLWIMEFPEKRDDWPKSRTDRSATFQHRSVKGAKSVAEYVLRTGESTVTAQDSFDLPDGTTVHWYLRKDDKVDTGGVGSNSGFIAVMYRGELYGHAYANQDDGDTRIGANVYRQFGIGAAPVRKRLFIVLEPPEYNEVTGSPGVAPSTGRADLYWMGTGLSPRSVKPGDWAEAFGENIPDEIQAALLAAADDARKTDESHHERMKRVMDRFKDRWTATRARITIAGDTADTTTVPTSPGTAPRAPIDSPPPRRPRKKRVIIAPRRGPNTVGPIATGDRPAKLATVKIGLPEAAWVTADDIADRGMIAAWEPPSTTYPAGCVQLDKDHPVIQTQVEYWQSQYSKAFAVQVEQIVRDAYADVAVAKVAHMHTLTGSILSEEQRDEMLQNPALTTSLLGLISEDALISPRLGGLGAKRRRDADAATGAVDQVHNDEAAPVS